MKSGEDDTEQSDDATEPRSDAGDRGRDGAPERRSILVIGYGSLLRGDDGAGRWVAQRLADPPGFPGLQVIETHQLTPELAEPISQASVVLFVDASAVDAPGTVTRRAVQVTPESEAMPGPHDLSPGGLLGMARWLYGRCADAWLIGIGARSFELSEGLSAEAADAAGRALRIITRYVTTGEWALATEE